MNPWACAPDTCRRATPVGPAIANPGTQATPRGQRPGVLPGGGPPCGPPRTLPFVPKRRRREVAPKQLCMNRLPRHLATSRRGKQPARRGTPGVLPTWALTHPNSAIRCERARHQGRYEAGGGGADPCTERGARPTTPTATRARQGQDRPPRPGARPGEGGRSSPVAGEEWGVAKAAQRRRTGPQKGS